MIVYAISSTLFLNLDQVVKVERVGAQWTLFMSDSSQIPITNAQASEIKSMLCF